MFFYKGGRAIMLAILGFLMVITFLYLIMSKRVTPFTGLIIVPVIYGIIGGFGFQLGPMMMDGVLNTAPTALLILFAILYFGIMIDTGLFEPLTNKIIKIAKGDPLKVIVGTAILAGIVGLDGDGSTTIIIVVSAFLPIYIKLGIKPIILASITVLQIAITTLVPWGGPVGRVASVLNLDPTSLFRAMVPGMIVSLIYIVLVAYIIGRKERARLGIHKPYLNMNNQTESMMSAAVENVVIKRPKLRWLNFILTIVIMAALLLEWLPPVVLFILGTAIALLINYPSIIDQRERVQKHAPNALSVTSIMLAAGVFAGILKETQMSAAMAQSLITIIPDGIGSFLPIVIAVLSIPGLFLIGPDAFYFGIIPVIAETASIYGVSEMEIAIASLYGTSFGFIGPLVGAMYLLTEMTKVNLGDVQKYAAKWAIGVFLIYIIIGISLGHVLF